MTEREAIKRKNSILRTHIKLPYTETDFWPIEVSAVYGDLAVAPQAHLLPDP